MRSKILTGKPTGKTLLGRPKYTCEDNIRIYLKEISVNMGNCIDLAYWRAIMNVALKLWVELVVNEYLQLCNKHLLAGGDQIYFVIIHILNGIPKLIDNGRILLKTYF